MWQDFWTSVSKKGGFQISGKWTQEGPVVGESGLFLAFSSLSLADLTKDSRRSLREIFSSKTNGWKQKHDNPIGSMYGMFTHKTRVSPTRGLGFRV